LRIAVSATSAVRFWVTAFGQAVHGLKRRRHVRHPFGDGALPDRFGRGDGVRVELADRRHVAADAVVALLVGGDAPDMNVREVEGVPRCRRARRATRWHVRRR
jgi:hypothetical protein